MNPVKVTDRLAVDLEVAMILLQMSSGLSSSEFEKSQKLPAEVPKPEFVQRTMPKKVMAAQRGTKPNPVILAVTKPSSLPSLASQRNEETVPAKKRGRPKKMDKCNTMPPAKKAKNMHIEVKEEIIGPSTVSNRVKTAFQSKIQRVRKFSQKSEHDALAKLRSILMGRPVDSYQPEFVQKFVANKSCPKMARLYVDVVVSK